MTRSHGPRAVPAGKTGYTPPELEKGGKIH